MDPGEGPAVTRSKPGEYTMYLVMVIYNNRINHIMPFDPMVWSHPDSAWELACDYANSMAAKLGFDLPYDHWVKDSNDNEFHWCGVSVVIERAYTPMRNEGVMAVAKAHAVAYAQNGKDVWAI